MKADFVSGGKMLGRQCMGYVYESGVILLFASSAHELVLKWDNQYHRPNRVPTLTVPVRASDRPGPGAWAAAGRG